MNVCVIDIDAMKIARAKTGIDWRKREEGIIERRIAATRFM